MKVANITLKEVGSLPKIANVTNCSVFAHNPRNINVVTVTSISPPIFLLSVWLQISDFFLSLFSLLQNGDNHSIYLIEMLCVGELDTEYNTYVQGLRAKCLAYSKCSVKVVGIFKNYNRLEWWSGVPGKSPGPAFFTKVLRFKITCIPF